MHPDAIEHFDPKFRFRRAKMRNAACKGEARLVDRLKQYRYLHGMLKPRKQPKRRGHHGWRNDY
jgi:hypothetical protein